MNGMRHRLRLRRMVVVRLARALSSARPLTGERHRGQHCQNDHDAQSDWLNEPFHAAASIHVRANPFVNVD